MYISKNTKKNERRRKKAERYLEGVNKFKTDSFIKLTPQRKYNEIYVQIELYNKLVFLGYSVYIEYRYKIEGKSLAILDIVILNPKRNIIVEVKRKGKKVMKAQIRKYSKFDAELLFCIGRSQIEETIKTIDNLLGR